MVVHISNHLSAWASPFEHDSVCISCCRARLSLLERRLSARTRFFQTGNTTESCSNGLAQALKRLETWTTNARQTDQTVAHREMHLISPEASGPIRVQKFTVPGPMKGVNLTHFSSDIEAKKCLTPDIYIATLKKWYPKNSPYSGHPPSKSTDQFCPENL